MLHVLERIIGQLLGMECGFNSSPQSRRNPLVWLTLKNQICYFRKEKGTGAEIRLAIVSGIVTGKASVSYWPIIPCPQWQSQKSLQTLLDPVLASFL